MNRILCLPATKLVAFITGYFAAVYVVRDLSVTFDYYMRIIFGSRLRGLLI
jgi:hypothetical protein